MYRQKARYLLLAVLSLCFGLQMSQALQAQDLVWAKRAGGTSIDFGRGIAVDGSGNSHVTGEFFGSATFGPGETNETTLTSAGNRDIFVAKYDASGDLVWAKRAGAGGASFDQGLGIAVDGSGNSYVTGHFVGSATFGPGETNETTLTSAGFDDIFVAKYDASGDLVWAKRAGGMSFNDFGQGIAVDGSGNSYVTGNFQGSATFGPGETNQTILNSAGGGDIFVAKYDASGDLVWAKRAGGTAVDVGNGIAVDGSGNSYVTGDFGGSATFGPGETNETTLTSSAGSFDIFVAKYDAPGDLVWAKRAGGTSIDFGRGIAVDGSGNGYVTGNFNGSATFGPGQTNETTLTSAGSGDIFVAKYDASGDLVWAKRAGAGGASFDQGRGIAVDGSGSSYVTGNFNGPATFGPGETNETTLTSTGFVDIFVAKYDASGDLVWAKRAGGTGFDEGRGIAVDGSGNSYVTGRFNDLATFGPGGTNETTLTSAGSDDIFVAKYGGGVPAVATILAASGSLLVAPGSIASGFGDPLAPGVEASTELPLPTELLGVSVRLTDSAGVARLSQLFVVTPTQINFFIDAATALGLALVEVLQDGEVIASGTVQVVAVAPGIFTANADGEGVPAAFYLRFRGTEQTAQEFVFDPAAPLGARDPVLIDFGGEDEQVFIAIFGTGMRGGAQVTATLDGEEVPVSPVVALEDFVGLDQANLGTIPRSFIGRGVVELRLFIDGIPTNVVLLLL